MSKISYSVFFLKSEISLFSFGLTAIFQRPWFCSLLASLALTTHTHISSYFIPYFYGKHVYFQDLYMPKKSG